MGANEGTRLRKVPASSELNDWLLLVITGLNWLHGVTPKFVFVGLPSKVQTKAMSAHAGEVWWCHGRSGLESKTPISHRGLHCRMFGFGKNLRSSSSSGFSAADISIGFERSSFGS